MKTVWIKRGTKTDMVVALRMLEEMCLGLKESPALKLDDSKEVAYDIIHAVCTCHDGCPVKKHGRRLISEWNAKQQYPFKLSWEKK